MNRAHPRHPSSRWLPHTAACAIALACAGWASADFPNLSGNAHVNGRVNAVGPLSASQSWSRTNMTCLISWVPLIEGTRVFLVRQTYA